MDTDGLFTHGLIRYTYFSQQNDYCINHSFNLYYIYILSSVNWSPFFLIIKPIKEEASFLIQLITVVNHNEMYN